MRTPLTATGYGRNQRFSCCVFIRSLTLAASSGCECSLRELAANSLTYWTQMAAGARYECSLREFAAMGGKAGIPRGTFRLVKRPSDLIPWVIFQRRSTHIGLWSPPRPSRISHMVGAHPRECSRVAPAARLTVSCADRADARENPVGNRRPGDSIKCSTCPLPFLDSEDSSHCDRAPTRVTPRQPSFGRTAHPWQLPPML